MNPLRSSLLALLLSTLVTILAIGGCQAPLPALDFTDAGGEETPEPEEEDAGPVEEEDASKKPPGPGEAPVPEIDSIQPNSATVGSVGPSIKVLGSGFVERSVVQLDGAPLTTSFVSATEVRATIPTSKLATIGTLRITVGTAPPGGGASKDIQFSVVNPAPSVTALDPLSVLAASSSTSLEVTGEKFVDGSKIVFGTTDLATTFVSKTSLRATIPSNLLVNSGTVPVKVVTPAPGGGTSTSISFTVSNPEANISSISPFQVNIGSAATTLTVNGTGFIASSTILFNGNPVTTSFGSASRLTATIPAPQMQTAGDFPVSVQNQPPGGGVSAPVVFKVQYPSPTASTMSPSTVLAGAPPTDITVTGTGFYPASQITFDGAVAATTFISATQVRMTVPAADLKTAASHQVRVMNPTPGGGTSTALSFNVTNPAPTLTTVNPTNILAGSSDTTITLTGTNFTTLSQVKSNGTIVGSNYSSSTSMTAILPAGQLANTATLEITVTNPAPGGGTSAKKTISVAPPVTCPEAGAGGGIFNNHCYFLHATAGFQTAASTACSNAGAHLVTITTAAERDFVSTIGSGDRWIGLTRVSGTPLAKSSFTWVTGETPVPDFWALNEPNGSSSLCGVIDSAGQFQDRLNTNNYMAICERE